MREYLFECNMFWKNHLEDFALDLPCKCAVGGNRLRERHQLVHLDGRSKRVSCRHARLCQTMTPLERAVHEPERVEYIISCVMTWLAAEACSSSQSAMRSSAAYNSSRLSSLVL
jgi:hypothetical protein